MEVLPPQTVASTGPADALFNGVRTFFEQVIGPFLSSTYAGPLLLLAITLTVGAFAWGWIRRAF